MAFSFGQSSAAQASAGPSFGSSTGGLFGSTAFSFGASNPAQSTPSFSNPFLAQSAATAFGAASSGSGLFGTASSSAFSFSAPTLFRSAASQAASAPSLFGGATSSFGGFGTSQPASQPALTGGFGSAQTQSAAAGYASGHPDYSALRELEAIASAYNPASPRYRFKYLFLNVVDNPAARIQPLDVDELHWRAAMQQAGGPDNPDRLWPVQAKGFKDLIARKNAQDEAIKEHASRLQAAEHASRQLARKQETLIKERVESIRRKHLELSHMLLQSMRHVDALEGRFAASQGHYDSHSQEVVGELRHMLSSLEAAVAPASAGGLQRRVQALATAARLREAAPIKHEEIPRLDDSSLASVYNALQQQSDAIARLQDVLRRDNRDLAILEDNPSEAS